MKTTLVLFGSIATALLINNAALALTDTCPNPANIKIVNKYFTDTDQEIINGWISTHQANDTSSPSITASLPSAQLVGLNKTNNEYGGAQCHYTVKYSDGSPDQDITLAPQIAPSALHYRTDQSTNWILSGTEATCTVKTALADCTFNLIKI